YPVASCSDSPRILCGSGPLPTRPARATTRDCTGATQPATRDRLRDTTQEAAMSTTEVRSADASVATFDLKLEVVIIPVFDVERSKQFYEGLGWRLDADIVRGDDFRIVQFTPPGSGCSVSFGKGVTPAPPGSAHGELIVSDIMATREALVARGVEVSEV